MRAVPDTVAPASIAAALGAAAAVTAGRQALLRVWPAFAAASQRSNRQVSTATLSLSASSARFITEHDLAICLRFACTAGAGLQLAGERAMLGGSACRCTMQHQAC